MITGFINEKNQLVVNLIEEYAKLGYDKKYEAEFDKYKSKIKNFTETNTEHNLKAGDTITFIAGYNNDIEFTTKILGFNAAGEALVLWDCYWFPINLNERIIK